MKSTYDVNKSSNHMSDTKKMSDKYLNDLANKLFKSLVEPVKFDRRLLDLGYKPKDLKKIY